MYIDVNGEQGRTALDEDVVGVNIGSIVLQQGDIGAIFQPSGFSEEQCENARAKGAPINECRPGGSDYWAYAVYRCWNEGKQLPTREQLATIANEIYDLPVGRDGTTSGLTVKNPELWAKLVSPDSGASFWSSDECNAYGSYSRVFSSSSSTGYSTARNTTYFKAFCLGDE